MSDVVDRINAYLSTGGLFNPEMANHDAVRDLLIECRAQLAAARDAALDEVRDWHLHKSANHAVSTGRRSLWHDEAADAIQNMKGPRP